MMLSAANKDETYSSEIASGPKLNLGCGPVQPDGWINVDNSNRAKLASKLSWLDNALVSCRILSPTEFGSSTKTFNLRKPLPYQDNSVAVIYGGEVLEHFTRDAALFLLKECHRVLMPHGVLRLRVPDNYRFWSNYVEEYKEVHQLPRSCWNEDHTRWIDMFFRDICVEKHWVGSMGHFHKWMFDEVSLIFAFERAGFSEVDRRKLHDSRIPDVDVVETRDDLIVEGIKSEHE